MKNKFKGYYKPQGEDLENLWNECIFIFDTNVLFDFYRYSEETVDVLLTIFDQLKERIWIPHWVGLEYHRGLEDRIKEQVDKYTSTIKDLTSFSGKIKSQREHPFLSSELQNEIESFHEKFNKELRSQKDKLKNLITDNPVKEKLSLLIGDNIGEPLTEKEEKEIIRLGDIRLSNFIPPGFADYKKKASRPGLDKYGDYIIWTEILEQAKTATKPVIFVTFDTKEDWYKAIKFNNSKILCGPRPELIEEFFDYTQNGIWLYPTTEFIDKAVSHFKIDIEEAKLTKVKKETTKPIESVLDESNTFEVQNEQESSEVLVTSLGEIGTKEINESEKEIAKNKDSVGSKEITESIIVLGEINQSKIIEPMENQITVEGTKNLDIQNPNDDSCIDEK